jgi:tRNA(fMet)-specific endonuclease VapC
LRKIFLDTSAYSAFKRGSSAVLEEIRQADQFFLNAVILGELFSGFDDGRFRTENRKELREFIAQPSVMIIPITEETAERYSTIFLHLKKQGRPVSTNDLWIAASVMETGSMLITGDRHFEEVPQIQTIFV